MISWAKLAVQGVLRIAFTMLSSFAEVTYSYAYSLFLYFRTVWPLSLVYGQPLQPPSPRTQTDVEDVITRLKQDWDKEEKGDAIMPLLDLIPSDEDVLSVTDAEDGFDVLQHAVMADCKDVVMRLLRCGCCPNRYHCSPPLHLAAYLGRTNLLKMLLVEGADPKAKRGVCFPDPHLPVGSEVAYFGFSQQQVYHCSRPSHALTPMQCAIKRSNLPCIHALTDALLKKKAKKRPVSAFNPLEHLQYACKEGAAACIQHFVDRFPECINKYGPDGDTPLLTAVPWGEECVKILVNNGADVHLLSRGIGETALHRLYRMNIDGLFTIYDTTRYLLSTGIEQDINALTDLGETPLHMLVSHVSYAGGNYVDPSRHHLTRAELQGDYQTQVLMAIEELLQFNADPLMLNGPGLQPLSRMLHIALKACHQGEPCPCVRTSQPDMFIVEYQNDYATLAHAMEVLLEHEAPVDFTCAVGHTPLVLLVQCFQYDSVPRLVAQAKDALKAVETLVHYGANVNFTDSFQGTAATLVAMVCRRCFSEHTVRSDPVLQASFAQFTNDLLRLLLSNGLDPNHKTQRSSPFLRGGTGNALIEFVRLSELATTCAEFSLVYNWLLTLLQWGADPDLEPYQSEPIICHSQSSIFLKKQGTQPVSLYLQKARERQSSPSTSTENIAKGTRAMLQLFYNAMDHKALYDCLQSARGMAGFHVLDAHSLLYPHTDSFISTVHSMTETPRSLKQIARVSVYKALNRRVAERVDTLPLPWAVKQYLLDFS
ncbi:serine/threonine-protein phosphatase 6 regulatory ankyrin repeat subunit B-like [Littorina saxatilis]|uniref:SOCS box domain-containing protein n=2 Tax=Littorina saxatilis TaxID=31220 RepID=A0AAN9BNG3_9CAEN